MSIGNDMEGLDALFYPKRVAVIGASRNAAKFGHIILKYMLEDGYKGKIYPINQKAEEVLGLEAYSSIKDVPDVVDLVVVAVPARVVPTVMQECVEKKAKSAVIVSAGFSEIGKEGKLLQDEVIRIVKDGGIRTVGPNCLGIVNTDPTVRLNATFGSHILLEGPIAFVSQSGAFADAVFAWAQEQGIGFSKFVSIGNMCDVNFADLMLYFKQDERSAVITMYIEGIDEGREFMEIAKRVARRKPILVLKSGRSQAGMRAIVSHTGSLAGSDSVYDAAFKQSGVIRASGVEELFDMARALAFQCPPRGDRLGIITHAGGPAIMTVDACESYKIRVPSLSEVTVRKLRAFLPGRCNVENPLDVVGDADLKMYNAALDALGHDENIDALIISLEGITCGDGFIDMKKWPDTLSKTAEEVGKPTLVLWMFAQGQLKEGIETFEKNGIPVYSSPERVARALAALIRYGEFLRKGGKRSC